MVAEHDRIDAEIGKDLCIFQRLHAFHHYRAIPVVTDPLDVLGSHTRIKNPREKITDSAARSG